MRRLLLLLPIFLLTSRVADAQLGVEPEFPARQNLGPSINGPSIEILPVVSPDGKTLYFDKKYDSTNIGGIDDDDDIYYSTLRTDGTWSPARNIGPPLNTRGSDVLFWISADGMTALVHNGGLVKGTKIGLAISRRDGTSWGAPTPIRIAGLTDIGESYYAYITPDLKRLILSINRGKSDPEDFDLFVCESRSTDLTSWGAPEPIITLNTDRFEGAPFMATDNRTFYFNSDRTGGAGETDLYMTRRIGNGWQTWTPPVNMSEVNTPFYEASISIAAQGDFAYMSGTGFFGEAFYGKSDLFRIRLTDSLRPQRVAIVDGRMLVGDRGVPGLIRAETEAKVEVGSTASDEYGRFLLLLPLNESYRITGFAKDHGETSATIDAHLPDDRTTMSVILNFDSAIATPSASDSDLTASLLIGPIHFATGSAELTPASIEDLRRYVASLQKAIRNGDVTRVAVTGHTDDIGESDSNQQLSLSRAGSVRRWLIANGVSPRLISTDAQGERMPAASNETEEGRAENRRVEVRVISGRR